MYDYGSYDIDYDTINSVLNEITGTGNDFRNSVNMLLKADSSTLFNDIYNNITAFFSSEAGNLRILSLRIIIIILLTSVFINLAKTFKSRQASDTGFYVAYMLLFTMFSVSFGELRDMSYDVLNGLLDFMKALIPTFFLTVSYVTGGEGALAFYQGMIALLGIVQMISVNVFLPAVNIYFLLASTDPMLDGGFFSNLLDLIEKVISWGQKTMLAAVSGAGIIQSLIVPAAVGVRKSIMGRSIGALPGVGNTAGTVFDSVLGAGILIKNAVGGAGLAAIASICAVPLFRLLVYSLFFRLCSALSQPAANDKRLLSCINAVSKSIKLLLTVVGMSALLFMLTIALITAATGLGM